MLIGYARVAKSEVQDATAQVDDLRAGGCKKIFQETVSGGRWDRPAFKRMLEELKPDDAVVVSALNHLASSLADLVYAIEKASGNETFRFVARPYQPKTASLDIIVRPPSLERRI